jgi:hypothetical protein
VVKWSVPEPRNAVRTSSFQGNAVTPTRRTPLVLAAVLALALLAGAFVALSGAAQPAQPQPQPQPAADAAAAAGPDADGVPGADGAVTDRMRGEPGLVAAPVLVQPGSLVPCLRVAQTLPTARASAVAVPAASTPNPCGVYVAECPVGSAPAGAYNVCTKKCEFGDPVPANQTCAPEPTKKCEFGDPVPVSQPCPPEPTKKCEFGDPVPVSKPCPPEPTKKCEFGDPVPVSKPCPPEPTKKCEFGDPVPVSKSCPPEPMKACKYGNPVPVSQDCPPEPTKKCQFGDPVPLSKPCPPEPTKKCQFGDPVPLDENCPPKPTKTCPTGVVVGLGEPCPKETVVCPNGVVVAAGQACPKETKRCPGGQVVDAEQTCPAPMTSCPGGIRVPAAKSCPPVPCPPGTDDAPVPDCAAGGVPPAAFDSSTPMPDPGELVLDKASVAAAEPLYARGAGCEPGAEVMLTTKGYRGVIELVGETVADSDGRFEAAVQFSSFRAGYREVTANCGVVLTSGVDMALTSATGDTSMTYVILVFFLLAGFLIVRFQIAEATDRRR